MKNKLLLLAMGIALSAQTLMAQVPSYVPTNGLVGYWPFNGNANDVSGNGNNGVVNGAALAIDRFGIIDKSYSFDGISNYISINNSSSLNIIGTQITLSFWLYSNNNPNDANYKGISKGGYDIGSGYEFIYRNSFSGDDGVIQITGGTGIQDCNVGYNMNAAFGQWIHLAVTLNNGVASFYVNGVYQVGDNLNQISQFVSNNSNLLFGKRNPLNSNAGFLKGKMDDVGIWNRALTQQEITNLFNGNQCITNITVTDTLIINVGQLSYNNPVTYANNITIAPNPASTQININFNNITDLNGGTLKVINSLGQEVGTTPITTSGTQSIMQLATWGGSGMYYVQIINPQGIVVDVKKIILQ
jgi:hypothetical protein